MAVFKYPTRDIDKPDKLLSFLGSHWESVYEGKNQVRSLMLARGRAENQKTIRLQEAVDSVSRFTVPTQHIEQWERFVLKESEKNLTDISLLRYGEGAVYGNDPLSGVIHKYGVAQNLFSTFPLPTNFTLPPFILNGFTTATRTLTLGLDYILDDIDNAIIFRKDPFEDSLLVKQDVFKDGVVTDREIELWIFRLQLDEDLIRRQFGYVFGISLDSDQNFKDYLNALWDGAVEGSAGKQIEDAFAALTDTPVVLSEGEVVEHIQKDQRHQLIITDKNSYRYNLLAVPIVSVGDVMIQGAQLVDTVTILEFHDGVVPNVADLLSLELGKEYLIDGFSGGISFHNKDVAVLVDTSGIFTEVEFEVGGFLGDTIFFWNEFNTRGIASPPTLAQLLDQRTNKVGEPTALNLPTTINPLEFLVQNVLRNNAFVIKIKVNQQGANRLPIGESKTIRKIIPPHTALFVSYELSIPEEIITMNGPGDDLEAGFEESPSIAFGLEPVTEEVLDATILISEAPKLTQIEGLCL